MKHNQQSLGYLFCFPLNDVEDDLRGIMDSTKEEIDIDFRKFKTKGYVMSLRNNYEIDLKKVRSLKIELKSSKSFILSIHYKTNNSYGYDMFVAEQNIYGSDYESDFNSFTLKIPRILWGKVNEIGFVIWTDKNPKLDSVSIRNFYIEAIY